MSGQDREPGRGSFFHAIKTIAWAFFGVRGRRGHEGDLQKLSPGVVVAVGLLMAAVFIAVLITLAKLAVG